MSKNMFTSCTQLLLDSSLCGWTPSLLGLAPSFEKCRLLIRLFCCSSLRATSLYSTTFSITLGFLCCVRSADCQPCESDSGKTHFPALWAALFLIPPHWNSNSFSDNHLKVTFSPSSGSEGRHCLSEVTHRHTHTLSWNMSCWKHSSSTRVLTCTDSCQFWRTETSK